MTAGAVREVAGRPTATAAGCLPGQGSPMAREVARALAALDGRRVWHVNTSATGGGVAELLHGILSHHNRAGLPTRWLVVDGDAAFFAVTKRLHHRLHGMAGDGGPLAAAEQATYRAVTSAAATSALRWLRPGDVAVLHDPQTLGMAPRLAAAGVRVVWQCHIGTDERNDHTRQAWAFLAPYAEGADRHVLSLASYRPETVPASACTILPPAIDPCAAKNVELPPGRARAALQALGLLAAGARDAPGAPGGAAGAPGRVLQDAPVPAAAETIVQVSRWDPLKNMDGVLRAFAEHVAPHHRAVHLVLAGPDAADVPDDPEGARVLDGVVRLRERLPAPVRARVHLALLSLRDLERNAVIVNALQRHASVVAQLSLREGFGLTVTEALWKGRPVVAAAVGGIRTQIEHGRSGLLVPPEDGEAFGAAVRSLLADPERGRALGARGRQRCRADFLVEQQVRRYATLFRDVLDAAGGTAPVAAAPAGRQR